MSDKDEQNVRGTAPLRTSQPLVGFPFRTAEILPASSPSVVNGTADADRGPERFGKGNRNTIARAAQAIIVVWLMQIFPIRKIDGRYSLIASSLEMLRLRRLLPEVSDS